jgi:hypothetical protein
MRWKFVCLMRVTNRLCRQSSWIIPVVLAAGSENGGESDNRGRFKIDQVRREWCKKGTGRDGDIDEAMLVVAIKNKLWKSLTHGAEPFLRS